MDLPDHRREFMESLSKRLAEQAQLPELSIPAMDGNTLSGDTRTAVVKMRERWRDLLQTAQQIKAEMVMIRRSQAEILTAIQTVVSIDNQAITLVERFDETLNGPAGRREEGLSYRVGRLEGSKHDKRVSRATVAKLLAGVGVAFTAIGWLLDHWRELAHLLHLVER